MKRTSLVFRTSLNANLWVALASAAALQFAATPARAQDNASSAAKPASALTEASTAPAAGPNTDADVEAARAHFLKAVQFYNNGDYKLSLSEFRRSYELSKNYRILYNIGQVNQQLNNYARALAALEEYLRLGDTDVPADRRAEVNDNIAELRKKTAVVSFDLNLSDAELWIDEAPAGKVTSGQTLVLDAGEHRVEARRNGYQAAHAALNVGAGDNAHVKLALAKLEPVVQPMVPKAEKPTAKNNTLIWAGWIATGALAVGAGITGALATSSASDLATLKNSPSSSQTERDAAGKQARSFAIASDVLSASAVVLGATSLYLTLSSGPSKKETANVATTRVRISPFGVQLVQTY